MIQSFGSFQGDSQFQTWLFRIAMNKARDYREKQQAAKRGGGQATLSLHAADPETGLAIDPPGNAPLPDANMMNTERMACLRRSLDRLGGPCQEVIELRYFGDLSYEEIGTSLNLNPKTVGSRLSKCLDQLEAIARAMFSQEQSQFPV